YHTYLGSAFALVVPEFVGLYPGSPLRPQEEEVLVASVIPADAVKSIVPEPGLIFNRVGGLLYQALPHRRFTGTINVIYEENNRPYRVQLMPSPVHPVSLVRVPDIKGYVALW
ncbi:MAG: CRISPR-associated protein Cas5, partial [Firmicutes bacterium]|nr:CRISPR-associated protein Cas5 [Bacillota bacterium]